MQMAPSARSYFLRVGGFSCFVGCAILLTKHFYPGYEALGSTAACFVGAIYLTIEYVQKQRRRASNAGKRRQGYKRYR